MTYIYLLIDPRTLDVRYVGKTISLKRRYDQQLYEARKNPQKCKRNSWIKSLLNEGLKPEQFVIDIVSNDEWQFWEIHYISLFRSFGFKLTNHSNGGYGSSSVSIETRRKLSKALKGNTNKKGSKLTDKQRKTIADSAFGRKNSIESRKKVSKSVLQFDKTNIFIKEWISGKEAARVLNINQGSLNAVCNKHRKTAGGYIWKFKK